MKKEYDVFIIYYIDNKVVEKRFKGKTNAISKEQAINNVRYRDGNHNLKDYDSEEYKITTKWEAEEVKK